MADLLHFTFFGRRTAKTVVAALKKDFSRRLLDWFAENRRDLPWRETRDPYRIWVSEIILQQTRVDQGMPYYHAFLKRFPTVRVLAKATEQEVLRAWQGLGYYSRARNMHRCARTVVRDHNGIFPATYEGLLELPGIGEYTAAAIASICHDAHSAVVDGNVYRVLARVFGIDTAINSPAGKKTFRQLADSLLPERSPGDYNQALMEFGALQCTPKNPGCDDCPFSRSCIANSRGIQTGLPVKLPPRPRKTRYLYYLVLRKGEKIAMRKRLAGDIWEGLHDFPHVESAEPLTARALSKSFLAVAGFAAKTRAVTTIRHQLTHQELIAEFHMAEVEAGRPAPKGTEFHTPTSIGKLPKPVHIVRFLEEIQHNHPA